MCGIVAGIAQTDIVPILMGGLKCLEYRGYDSAGLAILDQDNHFIIQKKAGKLKNLEDLLSNTLVSGSIGIAHTRWATHGEPSDENAHPHTTEHISLVHNGIIENNHDLRTFLQAKGYIFKGQTDTECLANLIDMKFKECGEPLTSVRMALRECEGQYAIAVLFRGEKDTLIGARQGGPLVVGFGAGGTFMASDPLALAGHAHRLSYLEEGDLVQIHPTGAIFYDKSGHLVNRHIYDERIEIFSTAKGNYKHFMLKEIFEQPQTIQQTLSTYLAEDGQKFIPFPMNEEVEKIESVVFVACGTAYYAGLVAKYWFEEWLGIPVYFEVASEFRYHRLTFSKNALAVFISQSGETADTLAAFRHAKAAGLWTLAIVNAAQSTLAREADMIMPLNAGPEIGVASTKAFTSQLVTLIALGAALAKNQGIPFEEKHLLRQMRSLPFYIQKVLSLNDEIHKVAQGLSDFHHALYIGRGVYFPLALEGALKLKELSYIHAEAYAAGELKHGPIALIDKYMPVVTLAPWGPLFDKTISNMEEVIARGARVTLITDQEGAQRTEHFKQIQKLIIPPCKGIEPVFGVSVIVQLLAYHAAIQKGTDVDQPRNLAKSVTVE